MTDDRDRRAIQDCISNAIGDRLSSNRRFAGVIGENPSLYSKSPALWNAAFAILGVDANYLPFDVPGSRLAKLVALLRDSDRLLGFNVTVPHKVAIMEYLDGLDPGAMRIQAVNTVVRTSGGRLIGYNTDGAGFIDSILKPQPGQSQSFIRSLDELEVLLIGAGGSARAVAFHIADRLTSGRILICNRTLDRAASLAEEIRLMGKQAHAVEEQELSHWAMRAGLVINSTTKGQGGVRELSGGNVVSFEPYSALAPAHPLAVPRSEYAKFSADASRTHPNADVLRNNENSLALARSVPDSVAFYDLIYFPEETVFLRHARTTGHKTMNGRAMIICQAARALFDHLCAEDLHARGLDTAEIYNGIVETMYRAW